jgi:hypothetical protein
MKRELQNGGTTSHWNVSELVLNCVTLQCKRLYSCNFMFSLHSKLTFCYCSLDIWREHVCHPAVSPSSRRGKTQASATYTYCHHTTNSNQIHTPASCIPQIQTREVHPTERLVLLKIYTVTFLYAYFQMGLLNRQDTESLSSDTDSWAH